MAYLDHAASSPLRPAARAAWRRAHDGPLGNPSGAHAAARRAKGLLEEARERIAARCAVDPGAVIFTSGGTEADALAVRGALEGARAAGAGNPAVVVSAVEHKAVLAAAARAAAAGAEVRRARVDRDGVVDLDHLAALLDERVAVVSVLTVNNETGVIQPLAEVGALVRDRAPGARLHTDAVQGAVWCDPAEACRVADLVSLSAHKLGGPVGVGALVRPTGAALVPIIEGGGQERGLRAGTPAVAAALAFAAALDDSLERRGDDLARLRAWRDRLEAGFAAVRPGAWVNGSGAPRVAGITNVGFPGVEADLLVAMLDAVGVCASTGSACASGAPEPSHVLSAMGLEPTEARACVRFSLGWSTTVADVDLAGRVVPEVVGELVAGLAAAP